VCGIYGVCGVYGVYVWCIWCATYVNAKKQMCLFVSSCRDTT
jgi:hypothetical protein